MLTFPYVLWQYTLWHYTKAWSGIARVSTNYLWFIWNFFSIGILFRTLFAPWRRLQETKHGGTASDGFIVGLIINTLMRVVGFFVRSATILLGAFVYLLGVLAALAFCAVWFFLPLIILLMFFYGVGELFRIAPLPY